MARRRRWGLPLFGAAISASILLILFGNFSGADEAQTGLRLAIPSYGAAFWPNYVAQRKGFYAKAHLVVKQLQLDPNITVTSLIGGATDVAFADSTQLVYAIQKNANLVAVGLSVDKQPYRLMGGPGITSIAQLRGRKVGAVSDIDVYTYVIRTMLRNAGLNPDKDVEWIIGGNQTRRMAAMTQGLIDAGLFSQPSDARLAAQGFHGLAFAPDTFPHLTLSTQTVQREWARHHGDALKRLLRAQVDALHWLYDPANKREAIHILMEVTGTTEADAQEAYAAFVTAHAWLDGCVHREGLVSVVRILREMHQLPTLTERDVPKFTDAGWCPAQ